ncbi:hypothetical protein [Pseudarthrobacter sp. J47]|uniref:hypothetical protein n=1 Tax=Pseudarthrobacter sp. J47 TaxID=3116482 RepID=UPI002E824B50|nr:hypothetical protein [Pseudarthrobacter sp. J47]MEE2523302.1 hypothetical protein [Pseudarthrobacter sp. J47]
MFSFGFLEILYILLMVALTGLAVYTVVLLIIFLRLRIKELKAAQLPGTGGGD